MLRARGLLRAPIPVTYMWEDHKVMCRCSGALDEKRKLTPEMAGELLLDEGLDLRDIARLSFHGVVHGAKEAGKLREVSKHHELYETLTDEGARIDHFESVTLLLHRSAHRRRYLGPMFSFAFMPALIFGRSTTLLGLSYNALGKRHERPYELALSTRGLRAELALRFQCTLTFRSPFALVHEHKPIPLGRGVDFSYFFHLTYLPFKDSSGGVLQFGIPIGPSIGLSYVQEAVLVPKGTVPKIKKMVTRMVGRPNPAAGLAEQVPQESSEIAGQENAPQKVGGHARKI